MSQADDDCIIVSSTHPPSHDGSSPQSADRLSSFFNAFAAHKAALTRSITSADQMRKQMLIHTHKDASLLAGEIDKFIWDTVKELSLVDSLVEDVRIDVVNSPTDQDNILYEMRRLKDDAGQKVNTFSAEVLWIATHDDAPQPVTQQHQETQHEETQQE